MKKLFGTDGIRGVAGQAPLDAPTVRAIGQAVAHHLGNSPRVLVGMDTRESGAEIAWPLTLGLQMGGATVKHLGIMTTPGIAHLTALRGYAAGIVISASHNPWQDNGIKIFGPDGYKLPDATELAIEAEIDNQLRRFRLPLLGEEPRSTMPDKDGLTLEEAIAKHGWVAAKITHQVSTPMDDADRLAYIEFLLGSVPGLSIGGQKIVIDCANGAAAMIAPQLFALLMERGGGEVHITHASPDGRNINEHCGALHPMVVAQEVVAQKATLGITFDGDADRALFSDELGNVVNGDAVLLLAARDLAGRGLLHDRTVVATTMSNMGLEAALKRSDIKMLRAPVGDKYVLEEMLATGASLGGEQSGHILFSGRSTTGDGLLTALLLLDIVKRSGRSLAELTADLKTFPQVIVNVRVREKPPLESIPSVAAAIAAAEHDLEDTGRVVIRYSGTEALARVMIEAESEPLMRHHAEAIAGAIRAEVGG